MKKCFVVKAIKHDPLKEPGTKWRVILTNQKRGLLIGINTFFGKIETLFWNCKENRKYFLIAEGDAMPALLSSRTKK
jgi:hypothetical protein